MVLLFLILIPLITGIMSFAVKGDGAKALALISSILTLGVSAYVSGSNYTAPITYNHDWIPILGTQLSFVADGMSSMLCLLTGIVVMVVMISNVNKEVESPGAFYGFLLLSQAGLMGVFLAYDALVFYVFWELALIPVYFLCSRWGGEKAHPGHVQVLHLHICREPYDAGGPHLSLYADTRPEQLLLAGYCSGGCIIATGYTTMVVLAHLHSFCH